MNINDNTIKNMSDLSAFLHTVAALDTSQLGSEWAETSQLLERHAKFIDTYTIPSMTEDPGYKGTNRIAELVVPERPIYEDLLVKPDESSTGFLSTGNGR